MRAAPGPTSLISYRRNRRGAEEAAEELATTGRRVEVIQADIAGRRTSRRWRGEASARFGRVDVWINNAGADILTGDGERLTPLEKLDLLLAVDLRGTILASWAAAKLHAGAGPGGVIINMSWDHVAVGMAGENPVLYSAAKGGVMSFSKSLAREVAPDIRVNILAPGFIETAFGQDADPEFGDEVVEMTPLRRWGTPDDVAGAAALSGLGRGGVHDRADDHGQRRRGDVADETVFKGEETTCLQPKSAPTTRRRSPRS